LLLKKKKQPLVRRLADTIDQNVASNDQSTTNHNSGKKKGKISHILEKRGN